jgi:hypothetical protein
MDIDEQSKEDGHKAMELIEKIKPILKGNSPAITSAVLADLLALFLAGHQDPDGEGPHMDRLREEILERWIALVRDLIPINVGIVRGRHGFDKPKH